MISYFTLVLQGTKRYYYLTILEFRYEIPGVYVRICNPLKVVPLISVTKELL